MESKLVINGVSYCSLNQAAKELGLSYGKLYRMVNPSARSREYINDTSNFGRAYVRQRINARNRKIEWLFTFEEWKQKWNESGMWHLRGRTGTSYVMCRIGDSGPYSYDNTYIGTIQQNAQDRVKLKKPKIEKSEQTIYSKLKRLR
jgi:hypothetical protein